MSSKADGGIRILPGGGGAPGGASGAFVRRFVSVGGVATLAGNTRTQVDGAAGTETVLENPTGVVQGGSIPANAVPAAFLEATDGGRFGQRVKILRIGNTPVLAGVRAEGTYAAPTPPLSGANLFQINARPVTTAGGASTVTGAILWSARENMGPAAWGTRMEVQAGRVGAATADLVAYFQSGGAGVAEWLSPLGTLRLVPGGTAYVIRDSGNTTDAHVFNAAGTVVDLAQSATTASLSVGSGGGSGQSGIRIRRAAGQLGELTLESGSSARWIIRVDNVAESGGNAGSDFRILARTDAAAAIDDPVIIARVGGGAITLGGSTNRQVIIAGAGFGAGVASLRFNGLTNGAGVGAGTLGNAPAAGNPAFWLPVSIAGTVRHIPCW